MSAPTFSDELLGISGYTPQTIALANGLNVHITAPTGWDASTIIPPTPMNGGGFSATIGKPDTTGFSVNTPNANTSGNGGGWAAPPGSYIPQHASAPWWCSVFPAGSDCAPTSAQSAGASASPPSFLTDAGLLVLAVVIIALGLWSVLR